MSKKMNIGVFDSGMGGLTVFKNIVSVLPQYNYIYLGDNARAPYGDHSFDTIYQYTLQCVEWLFAQDCQLVVLACNTASAKALRSIQQKVLPTKYPNKRVLGVIRPTAEVIGNFSTTGNIGVFGTRGTIQSNSYEIEIDRFFPNINVYQQSCPMWVPLIENKEHLSEGAAFFVEKYVKELQIVTRNIDVVLLGCTHYPLIAPMLRKYVDDDVQIIAQGEIVAQSLLNYLTRHPEMETTLEQASKIKFYTTGDSEQFDNQASIFFDKEIVSETISVS